MTHSSSVATTVAITTAQAGSVVPGLARSRSRRPRPGDGCRRRSGRTAPAVQPNSSSRPIGGRQEPLHAGERLIRDGGGDQPPGEQQRADAQPHAGDPVQDRQRHADRPAIDLKMGGKRAADQLAVRIARHHQRVAYVSQWIAPSCRPADWPRPLQLLTLPGGRVNATPRMAACHVGGSNAAIRSRAAADACARASAPRVSPSSMMKCRSVIPIVPKIARR